MRSSNPKLWSNRHSLTKGILASDVPLMICVSNLVSLCAIFTNLQASLVILAGLLATNNSSQLSPGIDHSSPFTIYHSRFSTLPLYSSVIAYYLAGNTSISSRPFAALSSRPAYTCPHRRQGQGREESSVNRGRLFPFFSCFFASHDSPCPPTTHDS